MLSHRRLRRKRPTFSGPDVQHDRKVSRLELFFDLLFVVIFRQLFSFFKEDFSWSIIREYTLYFIPIWMVWQMVTFYNQRFEDSTIRHRWYMFVIMALLLIAAISVQGAIDYAFQIFVGSFVSIKILLSYLVFTASNNNPTLESTTQSPMLRKVGWMHLGVSMLWCLLFLSPEWFAGVVFLGLAIEAGGMMYYAGSTNNKLPGFSRSYLLERYGLLILVALAEVIYGLVEGIAVVNTFSIETLFIEFALLGITFGIWWMYFDQITYRKLGGSKVQTIVRTYLHLPLTYLIVMLGGIILYLVNATYIQSIAYGTRILFLIPLLACILIIGILNLFHDRVAHEEHTIIFPTSIRYRFLWSKIVGVVLGVVVLYITRSTETRVFLVSLLGIMIVLNAEGMRYWIQAQINATQSIGSDSKEGSHHVVQ